MTAAVNCGMNANMQMFANDFSTKKSESHFKNFKLSWKNGRKVEKRSKNRKNGRKVEQIGVKTGTKNFKLRWKNGRKVTKKVEKQKKWSKGRTNCLEKVDKGWKIDKIVQEIDKNWQKNWQKLTK